MNRKLMSLIFLSASALLADSVPVITFDQSTGSSGNNSDQSVGWQFNVTTALTANALGWFDEGADGLGRAHTVGIWNPAGTLLASILIPSGTGASLIGDYRMVTIADLLLPVGDGYIVGGENFSDSLDRLSFNVTQVVDPRITYVDATFAAPGSGFSRPTSFSVATTGFYGPMFAAASSVAPVPEPGSVLLLVSAGALMAWRIRSRKVSAAV